MSNTPVPTPVSNSLSRVRKAIVAAFGVAAVVVPVLATADLSTVGGIVVAGVGILTVLGVYRVPNAPATTRRVGY